MLKPIKALLKDKKFIIVAIFITLSILCLSLIKVPKYNISIRYLDKCQHGLAYFMLALSWLFVFYKKTRKHLIVLGCILFGIIIEILQDRITNYRTGDVFDVIANSIGALLALLMFPFFLFKKKV